MQHTLFQRLHKVVIIDIRQKRETGMADYAYKATTGTIYLDFVAEYDQYCHYVAGLVGEGLSRIFYLEERGLWLGSQHAGLFKRSTPRVFSLSASHYGMIN